MFIMKKLFNFFVIGLFFFSTIVAQSQAGDFKRGKRIFNKCKACHSTEKGKHKIGPSLYKVFNRSAGSATGFKRYKGLKDADWIWNEKNLNAYLENPKTFVKNKNNRRSSMVLKIRKVRDRRDIISYLKSIK